MKDTVLLVHRVRLELDSPIEAAFRCAGERLRTLGISLTDFFATTAFADLEQEIR